MESIWPILIVLFFSTLTRSTFGFGDALLAMPVITMLAGIQTATPLVALVAIVISSGILLTQWRKVEIRATWKLIISSVAGIPVGLFYLKSLPESLVKMVLAVIIFLFALYNLTSPGLLRLVSDRFAFLFGFLGGIFGGAYNTQGPPVIIYAAMRGWKAENFRATLQGYFLPTGAFILAGHGITGLWTPEVVRTFLFSLPVVLFSVFLGGRLNRRIPREKFLPLVYILLILISMTLAFHALKVR